ncbi:hypothetical protein KKE92_04145 [Candidatus Micrarchaeota archaeon]|nr:hypothetical protein [Candidatus Micrarchaeota archaeon]
MRMLQSPRKCLRKAVRIVLPLVLTSSIFACCRPARPPITLAEQTILSQPAEPAPVVQEPVLLPPAAEQMEEPVKSIPVVLPQTFEVAMQALEQEGFSQAAEILDARVKQRRPKMKLTKVQATKIAGYFLTDLPHMPSAKLLYQKMPMSTVELIRATHERGVSKQDAEEISDYLVRFVKSMKFGNLKQLDSNHSHIIGREWEEIDYTGEGANPQRRKAAGERRGIINFKKAIYIHRYFETMHKAAYFRRLYQPHGKLPVF